MVQCDAKQKDNIQHTLNSDKHSGVSLCSAWGAGTS